MGTWGAPQGVFDAYATIIDAAVEGDPARGGAEWPAAFRTDVEALLSREAVEACVSFDVRERAPISSAPTTPSSAQAAAAATA
jgi:hypothetical protein